MFVLPSECLRPFVFPQPPLFPLLLYDAFAVHQSRTLVEDKTKAFNVAKVIIRFLEPILLTLSLRPLSCLSPRVLETASLTLNWDRYVNRSRAQDRPKLFAPSAIHQYPSGLNGKIVKSAGVCL
jgi:hypothetical protein